MGRRPYYRTPLRRCSKTHLHLPDSCFTAPSRPDLSVFGVEHMNISQRANNGRDHATYVKHHPRSIYARVDYIDMDPRWVDDPTLYGFEVVTSLGPPPTVDHSIDRIDGLRGYWLDNIRWADPLLQASNRTALELGEDLR